MGSQMGIVLYVIASGFVMAGFLNAMHQFTHGVWGTISASNSDGTELGTSSPEIENISVLALKFGSPMEIIWSIIMCFLAGPYLVLIQSYRFWRVEQIPASAFIICAFVSIVWSFCSGIFIVEAGLMLGLIAL